MPAGIVLGLALAVLAHQKLRGIGIYRTIFSSTVATSVAVASVIFGTLINPQVGLLPWLGIDHQPADPAEPRPGRCSRSRSSRSGRPSGSRSSSCRPGCRASPTSCSRRRGSTAPGAWSRFWHVTLPMLSPTIFFAVVVGTIFAFQTFGQIDLLTQGGPLKKTNVLTYFIYSDAAAQNDPGKAAVLAVALFFITLVLTLVQIRLLERRVHYER